MLLHPSLRIIEASDAAQRLSEARTWVSARADGPGVLIVSASRGAADDLARSVAVARGGAIGLHRFSVAQLAARLAAPVLAARGIAPVSYIGGEAVAARATFEASRDEGLEYFGPVARTPGFPRALARTLHELMLARVDAAALATLPLGGPDLARLLAAIRGAVRRSVRDGSRSVVRSRGRSGRHVSRRSRCCCSTCRWSRRSSSTSRGS